MFFVLFLIAFLAYLAYVVYLAKFIIHGLRTGKIAHTDSRQFADRREQPIFFWFLILLFAAFMVAPVVLLYISLVRGISAVEFSGAAAF